MVEAKVLFDDLAVAGAELNISRAWITAAELKVVGARVFSVWHKNRFLCDKLTLDGALIVVVVVENLALDCAGVFHNVFAVENSKVLHDNLTEHVPKVSS